MNENRDQQVAQDVTKIASRLGWTFVQQIEALLLGIRIGRARRPLWQRTTKRQLKRKDLLQQTIPLCFLQFFEPTIGSAINKDDNESKKN